MLWSCFFYKKLLLMSIFRNTHPIVKILSGSLYDLPTPSSLTYLWNFGSLLSFCLVSQIITGFILSIHYLNSAVDAFWRVLHIIRDVDSGFFFRVLHINGASFFFILIYIHIGRGIFFGSYKLTFVWATGLLILLILIGTAFLGYVLPWGQMSFWGATVITNLLSAVPYVGIMLVEWLWGGYCVRGVTLSRFFSLHFILPFVLLLFVVFHLVFLHIRGSSNSLGLNSDVDKIRFGPYFIYKDLLGLLVFLLFFFFFSFVFSYSIGDPENFNCANPLVTPVHIQPEWYFLFAYAILRSIPRKLGGVLGLLFSIIIFFLHAFITSEFRACKFFFLKKFFFFSFFGLFLLLTWIGSKPVTVPYEITGRFVRVFYFCFTFLLLV